ncbi:transposase [Leifsonia sp. NCR5]|nr:transposase [Leifsonia sp. NCR5]
MPVKSSEEFKRDAVAMVLTQGIPQKQVSTYLGIDSPAEMVAAITLSYGA